MKLFDLRTEYQTSPMAVSCEGLRFSWKLETDVPDSMQTSYRIAVRQEDRCVWDSGVIASSESAHVAYEGAPLQPEQRYDWTVEVTTATECASASGWFRTAPEAAEWERAAWIGAAAPSLFAQTKLLYTIAMRFCIPEGSTCGGLCFGGNDPRMQQPARNLYGMAGRSEIRYELDLEAEKLRIYRIGFHPDDRADVPFAVTGLHEFGNPEHRLITPENAHNPHDLEIRVTGSKAFAYLDGVLLDAELAKFPGVDENGQFCLRERADGRILNPHGGENCLAFPALGEIGVFARGGSMEASLEIRNNRAPQATLYTMPMRTVTDEAFTLDPSHGAMPMLRTGFALTQPPRSVLLYATARGIYEASCNGTPVSEDWLQPGAAQYDRHLYYQTYDLTQLVHPGENTLSFQLASGWWCDQQSFAAENENFWGDRPALRAMLRVETSEGVQWIATQPEGWEVCEDGPERYAGLFHGEVYDATRTALTWQQATVVPRTEFPAAESFFWYQPRSTEPALLPQQDAPVHAVRTLPALSMTQPQPGVYVYDLGQNIAGVAAIDLHEAAGTEVRVRYAEILCPDLPEFAGRVGTLMTENLREAMNTDVYICAGGAETFCPRQTFHGFRYIEVTGVSAPLPLEAVRGVAISSVDVTGSFSCSDPLVEKLFSNITWSHRDNFLSIPTDCPQRNERMGWAGDAQVFAGTAVYNAEVTPFLRRYLTALRDCQTPDGCYPNIAPMPTGFGGIAWQSAGVIIPYTLWRHTGDTQIIRENFEAMCAYLDYLRTKERDGLLYDVGPLGDWLAADMTTDNVLLWNAIYAYDLRILAEMADAIGADSAALHARYASAKANWNRTFLDPESGKARTISGEENDTQCAYALPLAYEIVDEAQLAQVQQHLARRVAQDGCTLGTGFLGTGCIAPALTAAGRSDLAYGLLRQRAYPSWLYSVTQGATTIWERWNSYTVENGFGGNNTMNSFNHYSLGAIGKWLYESVLGIAPAGVGMQHLALSPQFEGLDFARGSVETAYGTVSSAWEKTQTEIVWEIMLPPNTTASFRGTMLGSGRHTLRLPLPAAN